jgi:hypothetical protein
MTANTLNVDFTRLNGKSHGPSLPPSKRKPGVEPSAKSGVLQNALDREAAKRSAIGKVAARSASAHIAECDAADLAKAGELSKEFREGDDASPGVETAQIEPEIVTPVEALPVTADELAAALAIIERATKQQAEAIRKAAAERKKVAPVGEKIKPVKELTQAQKDKLAKAEAASATYSVVCMAAVSFVGKGLGESKKMVAALTVVSLPALRWLAKRYDLKIPADKKSALLIREFLRVELLNFKPKA